MLLGTYNSYREQVTTISNPEAREPLYLFNDGKYYRKIKGKRIVTNADIEELNMVYVNTSTIIIETKYRDNKRKKHVYWQLYMQIN